MTLPLTPVYYFLRKNCRYKCLLSAHYELFAKIKLQLKIPNVFKLFVSRHGRWSFFVTEVYPSIQQLVDKNKITSPECPAQQLGLDSLGGESGRGQRMQSQNTSVRFVFNRNGDHFSSGAVLGSSSSTAVEHRPTEQNSQGQGFNSRQVMGFLFTLSIPQQCFVNQVPQGGATLLIFFHKNR